MEAAVTLPIRVIANARTTGLAGWRDGVLTVRLQAPAVEGKANQALVKFLAKACGLPRGAVEIQRGATNRSKLLRFAGLDADELRRRLDAPDA